MTSNRNQSIVGLRATVLALGLAAVGLTAHAQAEVKFTEPSRFSDVGENERDRETAMKQIQEHIEALARRELPGRQLKIEFTDVDLAGELEPRGGAFSRIRVLRTVTIPRMAFNYVLSENGQEIKAGKASLRDMNYQDGANRYFDSEPLRYEKKMLDDWMAKELLGKDRLARVTP
ncbi:DUF3016 domain-containing protein [Roseateles amylovorans]|uniref:DUF3016 domain-containing protein n=1 Tax=Roseateles amylovorans TaxID=2978473 RepID=A0ABY6BB34_9BURK|nr:DUF3016 domain-containing protein [Roseateles amylovorans]UXH80407.1 DUF3016 domain-containing protein [Roseateles amylovorans]